VLNHSRSVGWRKNVIKRLGRKKNGSNEGRKRGRKRRWAVFGVACLQFHG